MPCGVDLRDIIESMNNTKALFASKVFWVAVLQAVIAVIAVFQTHFPELQTVGWLGLVKSFIDVFLRMGTSTPIGGIVRSR